LLSDLDSEVIRRYGILNDRIGNGGALLEGIPYPGVYVTDEDGVVVAKFFHDTYKKRDSPELLIDAALGRVQLDPKGPMAVGGDPEVRITAAIHGGAGTIRQGIRREVVVRFDLDPGLHIYGEPVPEGMIATSVTVTGPPGLVVESAIFPATEPLTLEAMNVELQTWSGSVDIRVPWYANGELASECRPLDMEKAALDITVRYQACTDETCLLPASETFRIELPLDVIDTPSLALHNGHGQREGAYDATPHVRRLMLRKVRANPLGLFRYVATQVRLEWAARKRARTR
jgi:hypothetical protein